MEGRSSNIIGHHANRERKMARKREVSPHPQLQQCWGTELKIFKVEETSYLMISFSSQRTVMLILLAYWCVIMALELHTTFIPNLNILWKQLWGLDELQIKRAVFMSCRQQQQQPDVNGETKWRGAGAAQLRLQQVISTHGLLSLVVRIGLQQDLTLFLPHR